MKASFPEVAITILGGPDPSILILDIYIYIYLLTQSLILYWNETASLCTSYNMRIRKLVPKMLIIHTAVKKGDINIAAGDMKCFNINK